MKHQNLAVILAIALLTTSSARGGQLGISYTFGGGSVASGSDATVGYEFQVTSPVLVVGLATSELANGGLVGNAQVGLWTEGGTELASATIAPGTVPLPGNQFAEAGINPILLQPGIYVVASYDPQAAYIFGTAASPLASFTVAPGINYIEDLDQSGVASLTFPTVYSSSVTEGFFGGNIVVDDPPADPLSIDPPRADPPRTANDGSSTLALLSGACLTIVAVRGKFKRGNAGSRKTETRSH